MSQKGGYFSRLWRSIVVGIHNCRECRCVIDARVYHCMIDGNDADFCSMGCIRKYSKAHSRVRIVLIETYTVPEKVIFT